MERHELSSGVCLLCFLVNVCAAVYIYAQIYVDMCVHTGGDQMLMFGSPWILLHYVFEGGSLSEPGTQWFD